MESYRKGPEPGRTPGAEQKAGQQMGRRKKKNGQGFSDREGAAELEQESLKIRSSSAALISEMSQRFPRRLLPTAEISGMSSFGI